jgi:NAD(P)-dependent dehydrogenase (short-subunit alcohol dehydrogenase family)
MANYEGLDVVITGGAGALGSAVCARLLDEGATLHVPTYNNAEAERFAFKDHARVHIVRNVDLSDVAAVAKLYEGTKNLWASIHIAGGYAGGALLETTPETAKGLLLNNALSAFLCSQHAVREMRKATRGGRIVNVSAKPALVPTAGLSAYAMSKAAVAALTTSLAEELKDEGIWVNAVVPSTMDTPANRAGMPDADFSKWPSVSDVAESILFLASPQNRATRGALVPVYGKS